MVKLLKQYSAIIVPTFWPHIYFQPFAVCYLILHLCREQHCSWWSHYLHINKISGPCLVLMFLKVALNPDELFSSWSIFLVCLIWPHSFLVSFKVLFFPIQPEACFLVIRSDLIFTSLHHLGSLESVNINTKGRVRAWVEESWWLHTHLGSTAGSFCDLGQITWLLLS